ncbi:MAG: hypothetical protein M3O15_14135 [Acidobacteriota bacterium]|nr:hypothetical protein [Acidobacteriota bacterium]
MRSASHETLVAYLREHGEHHTLKAIRMSLLSQGYAATAVEAACRSYLAETPNLYQEVSRVGWKLRILSLVVLALAGLGVLLVGACTDGHMRITNGAVDHFKGDMTVALALYLGTAACWWSSPGSSPPSGTRPDRGVLERGSDRCLR